MKEYIEKMKKEYSAPQIEVVDCKAQALLSGSDEEAPEGPEVILDD